MGLDERAAIITGAGRGIGQTIAVELASQGIDIFIADLNSDEMAETKARVEEFGQTAMYQETDLREEDSIKDTVDRATEVFDSIDILVNNAGIAGPTLPSEEIPVDEWDETLDVNLRGVFLMTREVIPEMKDNEYGRIVNIASVSGKRPVKNRTPYAASKLGMVGYSRSLAAEVGEHDINVNVVCPGSVAGDRIERVFQNYAEEKGKSYEEIKEGEIGKTARKEFVKPESVAKLVAFLCSEEADQITGQDLNISAGKVMY